MNLDAPTELPKGLNLSHSSIDNYLRCPEKWRRRYLEREYEPRAGHLIVGSAVHTAETQSYSDQVTTGEPHILERVMDDYSTSFSQEVRGESEVDWGDSTPGQAKDRGANMLSYYHKIIPPKIKPKKTEAEFNIRLQPSYKWTIKGYVDVIGDIDDGFTLIENASQDLKTVKRATNQDDLDNSIQGTLYTYAQMLEDPTLSYIPFVVHELKLTPKTNVSSTRLLQTYRTREQGERYLERVAQVAREIDWRMETGNWQGAPPGAWWCRSTYCGFYGTCPYAAGRP